MMAEHDEPDIDRRVEDIRAVRRLLAESNEVGLIFPWALFVWALLVAAGTIIHFELFRIGVVDVRRSLLWIWFPILVLGTAAETISFAVKVGRKEFALFNRRVGNAILACIASSIVLAVLVLRIALIAFTPGIAVLLSALPLVFFAQVSYTSLFVETFVAVAVGLVVEVAGAKGTVSFVVAGFFASLLYAVSGFHVLLIERRLRV